MKLYVIGYSENPNAEVNHFEHTAIVCQKKSDGLTGVLETFDKAFPNTSYRAIVSDFSVDELKSGKVYYAM